jgi:dolichol kinase
MLKYQLGQYIFLATMLYSVYQFFVNPLMTVGILLTMVGLCCAGIAACREAIRKG